MPINQAHKHTAKHTQALLIHSQRSAEHPHQHVQAQWWRHVFDSVPAFDLTEGLSRGNLGIFTAWLLLVWGSGSIARIREAAAAGTHTAAAHLCVGSARLRHGGP